MPLLTPEETWALTLTTFAGLSTTVGALFAVIRKPDDALLAFLLGNAIGVMVLLSVVEMWLHNAYVHGAPEITLAFALGALAYQLVQPHIPELGGGGGHLHHPDDDLDLDSDKLHDWGEPDVLLSTCMPLTSPSRHPERQDSGGSSQRRAAAGGRGNGNGSSSSSASATGAHAAESSSPPGRRDAPRLVIATGSGSVANGGGGGGGGGGGKGSTRLRPRQLLRLGLLMAVTMTLHNLPEGFAVAFAAFTDFGPIMALAIAIHNIPEGVIVAAPMYAATGSRWKAVALATASGLSEPVGALLALVLVKPFLTPARLHYILGFVGGLMAAVSMLELWPEARRCREDRRMAAGVAFGMLLMGSTLWYGV